MAVQRRNAALAVVVLLAVLGLGLLAGVLTEPERARTPVREAILMPTGEVRLLVGTCTGHPELEVMSDDATEVVIAVISDVQPPGEPLPACLDAVILRPKAPLGERTLKDATTGSVIDVRPLLRG